MDLILVPLSVSVGVSVISSLSLWMCIPPFQEPSGQVSTSWTLVYHSLKPGLKRKHKSDP
jgi:hypothetical protein